MVILMLMLITQQLYRSDVPIHPRHHLDRMSPPGAPADLHDTQSPRAGITARPANHDTPSLAFPVQH